MNPKSLLALVILSSVLSTPAVAQLSLADQNPLPANRMLDRFGLEMAWWGQATINGKRDKIAHVAIDERAVVMLSNSGILTILDAETGDKLWVNRIGRRDQTTLMPVLNDRLVMVVAGLNMYALDRLDGRLMWTIDLPSMPSSSPSADEDHVYVGTLDGSVYAFDLRTIRKLYSERLLPEYTASTQLWRYQAGEKVTSPPISTGRAVLFASQDNSLYAVSARGRDLLYQFESDKPVSAPLVMHGKNLYLASEDFNFYCLNAQNGQVRWSFLSGLPIKKAPHVIEGNVAGRREEIVYVLPDLGGINALSARTGFELWNEPQLRAANFLAASEKNLYVSDKLNNVLILDRETGGVTGMLPTVSYKVKIFNDRTDRLFLAREDGLIVMIREEQRTFPTYHKYPERRPILPELFDESMAAPEPAAPAQ